MSNPDFLRGRTVLQLIPRLDAGGAERTVLEVAEALVEAGARALVVSAGGRMVDDLVALGAEHLSLQVDTKAPLEVWRNAGRLAELIRTHGVDIVHARSRAPAWSARTACQRTGAAFVTTYHGAYSGRSAPKRAYNAIMAKGDLVIANSDWTAGHIANTHGVSSPQVVTIPRGVDVDVFDPERIEITQIKAFHQRYHAGANRLVFLLPGRLTRWKGQEIAISAFAQLPEDIRKNAQLILMGDPQGRERYLQELHTQISQFDLGDHIHILPHEVDMPAALRAADIVLAPSTRPEAFGRTAAEASAMARPVIVSDHGGAVEVVEDGETGLRVAPGDAQSLSDAMTRLAGMSAADRAVIGKKGRQRVLERFTKSQLQTATLGVYGEVLNGRDQWAA